MAMAMACHWKAAGKGCHPPRFLIIIFNACPKTTFPWSSLACLVFPTLYYIHYHLHNIPYTYYQQLFVIAPNNFLLLFMPHLAHFPSSFLSSPPFLLHQPRLSPLLHSKGPNPNSPHHVVAIQELHREYLMVALAV